MHASDVDSDLIKGQIMLHSTHDIVGYKIVAEDDELGIVKDIYFDDGHWAIRHFVVDTGNWLNARTVLISPISVHHIDWAGEALHVSLTREQVRHSPGLEEAIPVSRQKEIELHNHYGYPYYWTGPYVWGATAIPAAAGSMPEAPDHTHDEAQRDKAFDPHLRSGAEVTGYAVRATDGEVGHVEDFLFDDRSWSIRLIVIDPRHWWPGRHVLISPQRIAQVRWSDHAIAVNLTRDEVENSPRYDAMNPPAFPPQHDLYLDLRGNVIHRI